MHRWYIGVLALGAAIAAVWMYAFHASIPLLQPQGIVALGERSVILTTLALSGLVVIPVFAMLGIFVWKYRVKNLHAKREHEPEWDHENVAQEFVWWLVPGVIILALSVVSWRSSHALDPYQPLAGRDPEIIQVVALDWKWLFIYPKEGIASVNLVELPVDTPVHFEITADAPINSFWIPSLGGQIMAMAGMQTQLHLVANSTGDFNGFSANISGKGFSGMTFVARSVSQSEFDAWVAYVKNTAHPLDAAAYAALREPSSNNPQTFYSETRPQLFVSIIDSFMSPRAAAARISAKQATTSTTDAMMADMHM